MEGGSRRHRLVGLGASCVLHAALVLAVLGVVAPREPTVLLAELVPAAPPGSEPPAPVAKPGAPGGARSTEILTPRPPVAPPIRPPAEGLAAPEKMETPGPSPALAGATSPRESSSAASVAIGDVPRVAEPAASGTRSPSASGVTQMAAPSGITQMAIPSGGYQVRPTYPASARRLGIQGTTTLRIHVAADGRVADVLVEHSGGHVDLDHAAMDAVKRWRFEPARRGTEAVAMWVLLPVQFHLK